MNINEKKYIEFCKKLKNTMFKEWICFSVPRSDRCDYDDEDDLSVDVYEPMFNEIIANELKGISKSELRKLLGELCDYYGVGDNDGIELILGELMDKQKELRFLRENVNELPHKSSDERRREDLEKELDEYFRIGERIYGQNEDKI